MAKSREGDQPDGAAQELYGWQRREEGAYCAAEAGPVKLVPFAALPSVVALKAALAKLFDEAVATHGLVHHRQRRSLKPLKKKNMGTHHKRRVGLAGRGGAVVAYSRNAASLLSAPVYWPLS